MARGLTWGDLRRLAEFEAEAPRAVSVFLNLDPSVVPTPAEAHSHFHAVLDEAGRQGEQESAGLSHADRMALRQDLARLRSFLENEPVEHDGARGFALFSAGDEVSQQFELVEPVPDGSSIDRWFRLAPLVPLVGRGDGGLVVVASREQGRILRLRGGRLEEAIDLSEEQPRRHDQGGWSQARYQRHVDVLASRHLREVADAVDRIVREAGVADLVIAAPDESRAELATHLSAEVRAVLAGWTSVESHSTPSEIFERVAPLFDERRVEREQAVLDKWHAAVGQADRAAAGWKDTLPAASDARVDVLLVQAGADRSAHRCPRCGRAELDAGECPLDGTPLEEIPSGLDAAVRLTLRHGGSVCSLERAQDLAPVGGIGALLRF